MPEASTQTRSVAAAGGDIELSWASVTHKGRRREINQDAVMVGFPLVIVADGMGGHIGGEIASASTVDRLRVVADEGKVIPRRRTTAPGPRSRAYTSTRRGMPRTGSR